MCECAALAEAAEHALACWPDESCGVVIRERGRLRYLASRNVSLFPRTSYEIDPLLLAEVFRAGIRPRAFVHSHCGADAAFSAADRDAARAADGRPLHPGVEYWILALSGHRPELVGARIHRLEEGAWVARDPVECGASGCAGCVLAEKRL